MHGFGFSFALQESLQFAGAHLVTSLAAFNVGVELGQLLVLAVAVPAARAGHGARGEAAGARTIVLSALVAHTAWHWMTDRGAELLTYDLSLRLAAGADARGAAGGAAAARRVGGGWGLSALLGSAQRLRACSGLAGAAPQIRGCRLTPHA